VEYIRKAGGIASLAHPIRVKGDVPALMPELRDAGLNAIEAYHSDHDEGHTELYLGLAEKYEMLVTGGSDYHGVVKPGVKLGRGYDGNLRVPEDVVAKMRAAGV
jgi:predicted metal-dependent phosphoesterase TrpH